MNLDVRQVEYNNITVDGRVGDAHRLLSTLAGSGIDFLAFQATVIEGKRTLLTLFSDSARKMAEIARKEGFIVDGPHCAISVKGNEEVGALAAIYGRLSQANIDVDESSGIAHINGGYGVILSIKQEDCGRALAALS